MYNNRSEKFQVQKMLRTQLLDWLFLEKDKTIETPVKTPHIIVEIIKDFKITREIVFTVKIVEI